jgi:beta-N-acetylhexosaminidase
MKYALRIMTAAMWGLLLYSANAQNMSREYREAEFWADSVMKRMTPRERIGQLFMVAAYSKHGTKPDASISRLIREEGIGGLIFMQGGPGRQLLLTNQYQQMAKVPLMLSIDGEWGLAMRLDSTFSFPWQMTLGAIQDDALIVEMGAEIARQCKRVGLTMNLAPVIDVNNNPKNPVIKARSFGDNPVNVARKGIAYMQGMQQNGVLASAKHFPGHGDTDTDSHLALPVIKHSWERLDSIELYPFRQLIEAGLASVMIAHLSVPALDATPKLATTLSHKVVTGLLRERMGFQGLVLTDALNMKGVSDYYPVGEVDLRAMLAGNDILLFSGDVPKAIQKIEEAIQQGVTTQAEVDKRCKKILMAKHHVGLSSFKPMVLRNLSDDLASPRAKLLHRKLTAASLTLIRNENGLVPFKNLNQSRFASICFQCSGETAFQRRLSDYAPMKHFQLGDNSTQADWSKVIQEAGNVDVWIFSVNQPKESPFRTPVIPVVARKAMAFVSEGKKSVLVSFANPYALLDFGSALNKFDAVLVAYQNNENAQDLSAQLLFGGIGAKGKLPVAISSAYPSGYGLNTQGGIRLGYELPEGVGMDSKRLKTIDDMVARAIREEVFPGCQILVAKDNQVVFRKAYGHHTYDATRKVLETDLYDLASITKIAATVPLLMHLVGEGKVQVKQTLKELVPEVAGSNKANLTLRDILAHQAGLKAWIPFHLQTMDANGAFKDGYYSISRSKDFPLEVAHNLYAWHGLPDSIFKVNLNSPLNASKSYLYSDLGYYYLAKIIKRETRLPLDVLMDSLFSGPLGASTLVYNPLRFHSKEVIVPTEQDNHFRKQLVHGHVHDQGAALMGGVAGHAGLFGNANDLAKLAQLFLNQGFYGGEKLIEPEVIKEFVKCQFCALGNRRALGFDKPTTSGKGGTACDCVSYLSYGHSGFTGTLVWVDPEHSMVYVFLSNRINPDAENRKLIKQGLRGQIQQVFYDALNTYS